MSRPSAALARGFSNVAHAYSHVLTLLYPTVVLALERDWGLSYAELIGLMFAGQVLFGVAALPAGWLADRWSTLGMMVIFYVGTGAAAVLTGFARGPLELALGLTLIGLFGAIYHPVGIAWLVRTATHRGRALGVNGMFGAVGLALASVVAGALTDLWSWRAAFVVPGATAVVGGLLLALAWRAGRVVETRLDAVPQREPTRDSTLRAALVLTLTMTCTGFIAQALIVVLPKFFAERLAGLTDGGTLGPGGLVSVVFLLASTGQFVGGWLADRYSMERVYALGWFVQVPALAAAAVLDGAGLLATTVAILYMGIAAAPAENGLLAQYTPGRWRATAYGAKFLLSIGVAGTAVPVIGLIHGRSGDFVWLFVLLAALALLTAAAAAYLPRGRAATAGPAPAPAE